MFIAPSILSADFSNLLAEVKEIEEAGAKYLHIDVMDGHFVPNISFGPLVYKWLRKSSNMVFDVHLMISEPLKYLDSFIEAGADIITFHYEAVNDAKKVIDAIKAKGKLAGISIKPNTPVDDIASYLDSIDLVLIMSVEPGFGGQKFINTALDKISYLSELKKTNNYSYLIEVDGGINFENAKQCYDAGVDIIVAGNYIFGNNKKERIALLKSIN